MSGGAPDLEDRFEGAILGLALGDALGAPHEGGPLARLLWKLICLRDGPLLRWTDDTQMAAGLCESLIVNGGLDCARLARRWADNAQFLRGYGPGTRRVLARIRAGEDWKTAALAARPGGSHGNGAAMRAAPIGLFFRERAAALERAARDASAITHAHPLGIEGGVLMARAAALALDDGFPPQALLGELLAKARHEEFRERLRFALEHLGGRLESREVRRRLGNGAPAQESVVTALYLFCREPSDFGRLIGSVLSLGGDTDTIAAMAGALFGARNGAGALPAVLLDRLEARDHLSSLGLRLCAASRRLSENAILED